MLYNMQYILHMKYYSTGLAGQRKAHWLPNQKLTKCLPHWLPNQKLTKCLLQIQSQVLHSRPEPTGRWIHQVSFSHWHLLSHSGICCK